MFFRNYAKQILIKSAQSIKHNKQDDSRNDNQNQNFTKNPVRFVFPHHNKLDFIQVKYLLFFLYGFRLSRFIFIATND